MTEPFMYIFNGELEKPIYSNPAPVEFKNPMKILSLMPITSRILSLDRQPFTTEEIENDPDILKMAYDNTSKNKIRKNTDNDFISVRSSKTDVPCTAAFMLNSKHKLFAALNIDIDDYYIIFITPDEVLFADKSKFKPTQIKKVTTNIKNKMTAICSDSPILAAEVFIYDKDEDKYVEV